MNTASKGRAATMSRQISSTCLAQASNGTWNTSQSSMRTRDITGFRSYIPLRQISLALMKSHSNFHSHLSVTLGPIGRILLLKTRGCVPFRSTVPITDSGFKQLLTSTISVLIRHALPSTLQRLLTRQLTGRYSVSTTMKMIPSAQNIQTPTTSNAARSNASTDAKWTQKTHMTSNSTQFRDRVVKTRWSLDKAELCSDSTGQVRTTIS